MSCIPLNRYDREKLEARQFLAQMQVRGKVNCSDMEKFILNHISKAIAAVLAFVVPGVGAFLAAYLGKELSSKLTSNIAESAKKNAKIFIDKSMSLANVKDLHDYFFNKCNSTTRAHILCWGFKDAIKADKNNNFQTFVKKFENGKLSVGAMNWIRFLKDFFWVHAKSMGEQGKKRRRDFYQANVEHVFHKHMSDRDYNFVAFDYYNFMEFVYGLEVADVSEINNKKPVNPNKKGKNVLTDNKKIKNIGLLAAGVGLFTQLK